MTHWQRTLILTSERFRKNIGRMYGFSYAEIMYREALKQKKELEKQNGRDK